MSVDRPHVSVIVPVHDEAGSVEVLHRRLREVLGPDAELVWVDDGSTDGSRDRLLGIASMDPASRVLGFSRNFGKSHALAVGFRHSRGELVVTIDADLQDDPAEIPGLLAVLDDGHDLVGAWRRERRDPWLKVFGSCGFNWLLRRLTGVPFRDINCGLKVFRREVIEGIRLGSGYHRFLPLLAHWKGFRVTERAVEHHPRVHGRSSYGGGKFLRSLMDLAVLLFLERLEGRPGRYVAGFGALLGACGAAILLGLFVLQRVTGSIQERFPLLSFALLLVVLGVQFIGIGFMAELIVYHFRSREPREPVSMEGPPREGARGRRAAAGETVTEGAHGAGERESEGP